MRTEKKNCHATAHRVARPYGKHVLEVRTVDISSLRIGPETLTQILFGSAVITTVINVTWFVISSCLNFIARRVHLRVKSHQFVLGEGITRAKYEALTQNISAFYCLLIRYGTDNYITQMAK